MDEILRFYCTFPISNCTLKRVEPLIENNKNMKIRDICELLRSGEITLDYAGHRINVDEKYLLERYDDSVSLENGSNDGKWSISKEEDATPEAIAISNARMRDFYKSSLDYEVEQEDTLRWGRLHDAKACFNCGEHLHWTLTGNKLQLRNYYEVDQKHKRGHDWVNHPIDYVCPFKDPKPFVSKIKIESQLLIANYFRHARLAESDEVIELLDTPKGKEYSDEYALDTFAGRYRIAEHKAKQNIAYGQMGNMYVSIYINVAKDSIIIGPNFHPAEFKDYSSDTEYEEAMSKPLFDGYEKIGEISLDVWRWEATDLNTLQKYGLTLESLLEDSVVVDVPHGTWSFQHNYDIIRRLGNEEHFNYVYAKLDLDKPSVIVP
jgi:hypothetical protein